MFKNKLFLKLARFFTVGFFCAVIDFGLNFLLLYLLHTNVQTESIISHIISFIASAIFGYFANTFWVFSQNTKKEQHIIFIKYAILTIFNTIWSTLSIWGLVIIFTKYHTFSDINVIQVFSKVVIGIPLSIVSYYLYEMFVYVKDIEAEEFKQ